MSESKNKLARRTGRYFGWLTPFERIFDDFFGDFDNFFLSPFEYKFPEIRFPLMDLKDEENQYVLKTEIPGLSKENINIEVRKDRFVEIKGEKEEHMVEEEEGSYIHKERGKTSFHRHIHLPSEVDAENIDAKLENGVLTVTFPKKKPEPSTKVEVK